MVEVRVVDAGVTRELRRAVLRPHWAPGARMPGDDADGARHLAAFDGGEVVGACVLLPRPYPLRPDVSGAWQLRGMAVAPERQRAGIGATLVAAAVAELRTAGAALVWCDARTSAVEFYRRHGFAVEGRQFRHAETGIPHLRMWRTIGPEGGT